MKGLLLFVILVVVFQTPTESFKLKKKHLKFTALEVYFPGGLKSLRAFLKIVDKFGLDVWKFPANQSDTAQVIVEGRKKEKILEKFKKFEIQENPKKETDFEVKESMVNEYERLNSRKKDGKMPFKIDDANTLEEMVKKLKEWHANCPEKLKCRLISIGESVDGHPIYMFSIGLKGKEEKSKTKPPASTMSMPTQFLTPTPAPTPTPSPTPPPEDFTTTPDLTTIFTTYQPPKKKKGVWIDCLIHAREWITGTTCMLFINRFIEKHEEANVKALLEGHDWHFVPVVNPDGYEYSWGFGVDKPKEYPKRRLVRKNRKITCPKEYRDGVDVNRNFDDGHWEATKHKIKECLPIYSGPKAASEPETIAIQTQLTKLFTWLLCSDEKLKAKDHLDLLVTLHSFANTWMHPTARTVDGLRKKCVLIEDKDIRKKLGDITKAAEAASEKSGGQQWKSGPVCEALKDSDGFLHAPGNLIDFAFEKAKIQNSIAGELRGPYYTIGDVNDIAAAFEETWAAVVAMLGAV